MSSKRYVSLRKNDEGVKYINMLWLQKKEEEKKTKSFCRNLVAVALLRSQVRITQFRLQRTDATRRKTLMRCVKSYFYFPSKLYNKQP